MWIYIMGEQIPFQLALIPLPIMQVALILCTCMYTFVTFNGQNRQTSHLSNDSDHLLYLKTGFNGNYLISLKFCCISPFCTRLGTTSGQRSKFLLHEGV